MAPDSITWLDRDRPKMEYAYVWNSKAKGGTLVKKSETGDTLFPGLATGAFTCLEDCDDVQEAHDAMKEWQAQEPAPAPRWTLAPGRTLCYDGKPVATLGRVGNDAKGYTCHPVDADDLAHLLVLLLEGQGGLAYDDGQVYPVLFPVSARLADEARAVTPITLPTA